jgi:hypothetical protein
MNRNELDWRDMSELPEAGQSVLIHVPGDDEPVWFGFWDGRRWHYIEGLPVRAEVRHWCEMPTPPERVTRRDPVPVLEMVPALSSEPLLATVA